MSQYNKQWPSGRNQFGITEADMQSSSSAHELLKFRTRLGKLVSSGKIDAKHEEQTIQHLETSIEQEGANDLPHYMNMTDEELIKVING